MRFPEGPETISIETELSASDLTARLLQCLGAKEDLSLKSEMESESYHRLSWLHQSLYSNTKWMENTSLDPSHVVLNLGTVSTSGGVPALPDSPQARDGFIFSQKKLFKRSIVKSVICVTLLVGLVFVASWAPISQSISSAERTEKWLTLALFGCIAIAFSALGADRRRDLLREIAFCRAEQFDNTETSVSEISALLKSIGESIADRRQSISEKNSSWLGCDLDGRFEFHRPLRSSEIPNARLLLRKNGDITFSWGLGNNGREQERFVKLDSDGIFRVERGSAGAESGIEIYCDVRIA